MTMFLHFDKQELELRLETQKQTLMARDESIKKLLEMLQNKGMGEWRYLDFESISQEEKALKSIFFYYEEATNFSTSSKSFSSKLY